MSDHIYLLQVAISAKVRQSVQVSFSDLKLPESVVDAFQKQQAVSVRPVLSGKLKEYLSFLRTEQHKLYEECTINQGDTHFLHGDSFNEAMVRIQFIRSKAAEFNSQLNDLWYQEYSQWVTTVDNFLDPLFAEDPDALKIAKELYLSLFPTKKEFENPIQVFVVGPNPVCLTEAQHADDHPLADQIYHASLAHTTEVLMAAKEGAADRAFMKAAKLIDDLDVRKATNVSERQTGGAKSRGSWQLIAQDLRLISKHCEGFENVAELADALVDVGTNLQSTVPKVRNEAFNSFAEIKRAIRRELDDIVNARSSTKGLEALQKSLSLSGDYADLLGKIDQVSSQEELDELSSLVEVEKGIYQQRAKELQKTINAKAELLRACSISLEETIEEVASIRTPDF
jgi:hypothetical protein